MGGETQSVTTARTSDLLFKSFYNFSCYYISYTAIKKHAQVIVKGKVANAPQHCAMRDYMHIQNTNWKLYNSIPAKLFKYSLQLQMQSVIE